MKLASSTNPTVSVLYEAHTCFSILPLEAVFSFDVSMAHWALNNTSLPHIEAIYKVYFSLLSYLLVR